MKLTHLETVKYPSGLIEITVAIHKTYIYLLQSEYAHHKFLEELKHKKYGSAINTLKRFDCKKEKQNEDKRSNKNTARKETESP